MRVLEPFKGVMDMASENNNMSSPTFPVQKSSQVSTLDGVLVIVVALVLFLLVGGILFLINVAVSMVVGELLLLIVPLAYLLFKHIDIRSYVGADFKLKFLFLGIGLGVVLLFIDVATASAFTAVFGPSQAAEETNRIITDLSKSPMGLLAVVASLSLAGICEEFLFRGFLQNTINRRYSFLPAILVSAAIFGLFHLDPQLIYMLSTFVIGLFLGYVYHRWNSYVVSAIAHSTLNIIVLFVLLLAL